MDRSDAKERRVRASRRRSGPATPVFFSGEEALREVAKPEGVWNWALVGPDSAKLRLAGGGMGGMEEMSGVMGQDAHLFGLLRMTFGVGAAARTKFVFVHASDPIDSGNFSQLQHGRALASKPAMEKAIYGITACAANVHFQSPEDCTVEHVVNKLCDVVRGLDAKLITVENFKAAVEQHREQHPEMRILEEELDEEIKYMKSVKAPRPEVVQPEFEGQPSIQETTRLRKKVKLYSKGDMVEVWSERQQHWMLDGEVVEVAGDSFISIGDNLHVAAGSMMVVFDNGALYEWLTPQLVETHLRPSPRPRAPSPTVGTLLKETHGWFAFRHERYVELSKGFLSWWESEDAAKTGKEAAGAVYLLHLQMEVEGQDINLRSSGTKGKHITFEATTEESAEAWSEALWEHAEYCQELREVDEAWSKAFWAKVAYTQEPPHIAEAEGVASEDQANAPLFSAFPAAGAL